MKGFNFEKNLSHQTQAVESICSVFENIELTQPEGADKNHINPTFNFSDGRTFFQNIRNVHSKNGIAEKIKRDSHIIDVMMETGGSPFGKDLTGPAISSPGP